MTAYPFLDGMGDVVAQQDFPDHASAIAAWGLALGRCAPGLTGGQGLRRPRSPKNTSASPTTAMIGPTTAQKVTPVITLPPIQPIP